MKGFESKNKRNVEHRFFLLELNYQDSKGNESNIGYELLSVPRMKSSQHEITFAQMIVWQMLESEYKTEHINQVFALSVDGQQGLFRLQTRSIDKLGENLSNVSPPDMSEDQMVVHAIKKQLKRSLKEFFDWKELNADY